MVSVSSSKFTIALTGNLGERMKVVYPNLPSAKMVTM